MEILNSIVTRISTGNVLVVVPAATVTVYLAGTSTLATIYSDNGVTPKANPFTADAQGRFNFYAANGFYDIQTSATGYSTETQRELFDDGNQAGNEGLSTLFGRNKNYIDNPRLDIFQRGTSQTSHGYGTFDRYFHGSVGSAKTTSVQTFAPGDTSVAGNPISFRRTVVSSVAGASNFVITAHYLENVRNYSGKTQTFSFWAKADAPRNIVIEFAQNFGAGGSAYLGGISVQTFALTTSWQKFTAVVNWPSVAGKTIGLTDSAQIVFWMDGGSSFNARNNSLGQQSGTFDDAMWQLEDGSVATTFEQRPLSVEVSRCQRFYEAGTALMAGSASAGGHFLASWIQFKAQKRVTPTMSAAISSTPNVTGGGTSNIAPEGFSWIGNSAAAGGYILLGTWTASADL